MTEHLLDDLGWWARTEWRVGRAMVGTAYWRAFDKFDEMRGLPRLCAEYTKVHGNAPDLDLPKTFSEKIQWRKINDRREILRRFSDKARFRRWVNEHLGEAEARRLLVPALFEVSRAEDIPFGTLPDCYVIKVSHGSGFNLFVRGRDLPPQRNILRHVRVMQAREFGRMRHEWAYGRQKPTIIGEPMLGVGDGAAPGDLKFHMFDGRCVTIQANTYEGSGSFATPDIDYKMFMSPQWEVMDIRRDAPSGTPPPRPERLEEMLDVAERLSAGLDFIRVDFLTFGACFYLGEMTVYPSSGLVRLAPEGADAWLGSFWTLPEPDEACAPPPAQVRVAS